MAHVSIIGTGNMGQAISAVVTKGGNTAELLGRSDAGQPVTGDIVVLAVPYPALADALAVPADSSAAAQIAAALPRSTVLKAFNTNFAATLAAGTTGQVPATVMIAGDNTQAKAQLADVVTAAGLRAIDAGALRRARELEALGFLQITLAAQQKMPWTGGFAVAA